MTVSILDDAPARLRASVAALSIFDRDMRRILRETVRADVVPMMTDATARTAAATGDPRAVTLAKRGRYSEYMGTPGVAFGGAARVTSTGVPGRVLARGIEWGSPGTRWVRVGTHSRAGRPYVARRRTSRQFMPVHAGGSFVTPAADRISEEVLTLWQDAVEAQLVDALGGP